MRARDQLLADKGFAERATIMIPDKKSHICNQGSSYSTVITGTITT